MIDDEGKGELDDFHDFATKRKMLRYLSCLDFFSN